MNSEEIETVKSQVEYLKTLLVKPFSQELRSLLTLKIQMLEERINGIPSFQKGAMGKYLVACVNYRPGLTRQELREFAGIPGSNRRNETDTFRDCLQGVKAETYMDEEGRVWPRNGLERPVAKIGNVVLDGRITPRIRKALLCIRDNPGMCLEDFKKRMRIKTNKEFKNLVESLKGKVVEMNGKLFVDGFIPESYEPLPTKVKAPTVTDNFLDCFESDQYYDWSELVPLFKTNGFEPREAFKKMNALVAQGVIHNKNNKYARI